MPAENNLIVEKAVHEKMPSMRDYWRNLSQLA